MARALDIIEELGVVVTTVGHAAVLDPIPLEGDELEEEFKALKERLARKIPLGFRA
jgi:hypothetical protein